MTRIEIAQKLLIIQYPEKRDRYKSEYVWDMISEDFQEPYLKMADWILASKDKL